MEREWGQSYGTEAGAQCWQRAATTQLPSTATYTNVLLDRNKTTLFIRALSDTWNNLMYDPRSPSSLFPLCSPRLLQTVDLLTSSYGFTTKSASSFKVYRLSK
ncbi:hypothetical protein PoB_004880800 [Plakobranchus ocellatus]|uniref:Uncharacterized protein n=1 Tax=Plakobranchus ocellatus TaxID=259542 RepID=A0AAV4BU32_9GAST|nr:hypothetical protein PoB_004880800 [Plakobranchus ocellatus]